MKKNLTLLIGTNNKGKLKEIRALLPKFITTKSVSDFKIKSPKENGVSFEENSLIKSKYFSSKTKLLCLADDSGLEIDLLNKMPGIYSASWSGKKNDFNLAIKKVYKELQKKDPNWRKKRVKARFICVLSISLLNKNFFLVKGKIEGTISSEPKGKNGFGYDPIFIPKNYKKTFGEMNSLKKYRIDHRYQAFKKLKNFFKSSLINSIKI